MDFFVNFCKFFLHIFTAGITTPNYFFMLGLLCFFYYILPLKFRWIVFFLANLVFAFSVSKFGIFVMVFMMASVWLASVVLEKVQSKQVKKIIFATTVCLDALILIAMKDMQLLKNAGFLAKFVPIGISYWCLSLLAYLADCHRGLCTPERNPAKFFACAAFFPIAVSGPVIKMKETCAQIVEGHRFDYDNFCSGLQRILWGLFKKLVIAERAAIVVNTVYGDVDSFHGFYIWIATAFFFIQLFCDFSGCIDIILGSAQLFGINLPENFSLPFTSKSIAEFWRRWHITLGGWLRDYIYIPLGGNRKGNLRKYLNLLITFMVSGFWHGGTLVFVVWGICHAVYQIAGSLTLGARKRLCETLHINRETFGFKFYQCSVVFFLNLVAWVFFKSPDVKSALKTFVLSVDFNPWIFFDGSLGKLGLSAAEFMIFFVAMVIFLVVSYIKSISPRSVRSLVAGQNLPFRWALWISLMFIVMTFGKYGPGEESLSFIYMKF